MAVDYSSTAGCVFYPSACTAPAGAAGQAYVMAGRMPPAQNGVDGYAGCFQDCDSMTTGQSMDRVCDDVSNVGVHSATECKEHCAGYTYMGLACPISGNSFECWCCNSLDLNTDGSERLADGECTGGPLTSGIYNNDNAHCNGWPGIGDYHNEGYAIGGACRAAIYATTVGTTLLPTRSTQLIKVPQATSVHVLASGSIVAARNADPRNPMRCFITTQRAS